MMQRKILNVYFYRDNACHYPRFKMRLIEMQTVESFPPELDATFLEAFAGVEPPFALCLSDGLDNYNAVPLNRSSNEAGTLFRSLSDGYTREILRDGEQCYIYQDIDFLLFTEAPSAADTSYRGNDHDLLKLLGFLDDAVGTFRQNAANDGYEVQVNICIKLPDFSKKLDILRDTFASQTTAPIPSIAQHAINWLITSIHDSSSTVDLSPSTIEMADFMLRPILAANEGGVSLSNIVRSKLSIVNPGGIDTPRPSCSSPVLFSLNKSSSFERKLEFNQESAEASLKLA